MLTFDHRKTFPPLFDYDYHPQCQTLPRTTYGVHDPNKKWRSVWLFRNSVFKNWASEFEIITQDSFQSDWKMANIPQYFYSPEDMQ